MGLCTQATGLKGSRRACMFRSGSGLGLLRLRQLVPQNNNNEKRNRTATVCCRIFLLPSKNRFRDNHRVNCALLERAFHE